MACTSYYSEQTAALGAGHLDAAQVEALLSHVDACPACSEELDDVALVLASPTLAATPRGLRRTWTRSLG